MEKNKIFEYITKLQDIENKINGDNPDLSFTSEIDSILKSLNMDINNDSEISPHLKVKVKKLSPNAIIPTYSKDGDAGLDLTITRIISETENDITFGYDIAFEIPKGYVGLLFPRSSIRKWDLLLSNSVGVVDSGYRGEIQTTFKKTLENNSLTYSVGERGAQILIIPYPRVVLIESDELNNSERGEFGFGSSGA